MKNLSSRPDKPAHARDLTLIAGSAIWAWVWVVVTLPPVLNAACLKADGVEAAIDAKPSWFQRNDVAYRRIATAANAVWTVEKRRLAILPLLGVVATWRFNRVRAEYAGNAF
jgi:hypothetical protein